MGREWGLLGAEVWGKTRSLGEPPRLMYFVVVVVGIGGLGVWLSSEQKLFVANLATYSMGIAAAAAVELVLPQEVTRSLRMFAISLGTIAVAVSLLYSKLHPSAVLIAPILAWWLWVLSASTNTNLGSQDPSAATGGDTGAELKGDLAEFRTEN